MHRGFSYRLAPTPSQDAALARFAGVTRLIYNLALEQRRDWWRQYQRITGGRLNYASQGREVTALRKAVDWIGEVPSSSLHQALRDLDRAFANFFSGRARFPSIRRRGLNDSFRFQGVHSAWRVINARWGEVRIPNLGWVKFRLTRPMKGVWQNTTVSRDGDGWRVSFACEIEHEAPANDNPSVGIDRGIAVTLALSNGEAYSAPAGLAVAERRKRRAQKALARCRRGSRRRAKRLRRLSRAANRIARIRADWQHRVSREIAGRFGLVAIEDLKIQNMTARGRGKGKRSLNRSILNQAWGGFATKLAYKLEERGGALVKVNPAYSSQTCSDCGAVDSASRKSQAAFNCTSCGFVANADTNAAIVILRRSTPSMLVEGCGYAPVEARTCQVAA